MIFPSREISYEDCTYTISEACQWAVATGDIILVSGTSISSHFVTFFSASEYSHIGIIYLHPDYNNEPFIFESIRHNDDTSKKIFALPTPTSIGVKLTRFSEFLENFQGNSVSVRRILLHGGLGENVLLQFRKHMHDTISAAIGEFLGRPYENRFFEFFISRFRIFEYNRDDDLDAIFCSELVAVCLIRAGLLECESNQSCQYLPDDFSDSGNVQELRYPKEILGLPPLHYSPSQPLIKLSPAEFIVVSKTLREEQKKMLAETEKEEAMRNAFRPPSTKKKMLTFLLVVLFLLLLTSTIIMFFFR